MRCKWEWGVCRIDACKNGGCVGCGPSPPSELHTRVCRRYGGRSTRSTSYTPLRRYPMERVQVGWTWELPRLNPRVAPPPRLTPVAPTGETHHGGTRRVCRRARPQPRPLPHLGARSPLQLNLGGLRLTQYAAQIGLSRSPVVDGVVYQTYKPPISLSVLASTCLTT